MLYKNFDDLFVMDDKAVTACVNILEEMEVYYATRQLHGSGLYQVMVGYGFDISQESLPRVKEFFNDSIVIAADGAKYPWSGMEKIRSFSFRMVFLTRCMKMEMTGLMILMSTPRAHPIPAGTANNALIAKE